MAADLHNLGSFASMTDVWVLYPFGGCEGDYVTVSGNVLYWNNVKRVWGDFKEKQSTYPTSEIVGDLTVDGSIRFGGNIIGENAVFSSIKVDSLTCTNPPYALKDHTHSIYALKSHTHELRDIPALTDFLNEHIGGSGGGTFSTSQMWIALGQEGSEQIDPTHLVSAIEYMEQWMSQHPLDIYLSSVNDDTAQGSIWFAQSVGSDAFNEDTTAGWGWRITHEGDAWLDDVRMRGGLTIAGAMSSERFISGFPNGYGWSLDSYLRTNAAGVSEKKYRLEIDDVVVRGNLKVYEMVISQLRGENDNVIFAGMMKVDHYDSTTGRIYLDTDNGVLYNPFLAGDILMVQKYGGSPSAGNHYNVIKQYELQVSDSGVGSTSDGEKRLDWVTFTGFVGDSTDLILKGDILTRVDSATESTRKGIVKVTTIDETGSPYIDVVYGMKTDNSHATKVRMGNLTGIKPESGVDLTGVWGLYANGAYLENSTMVLPDGNTVEQEFYILNGSLDSRISEAVSDAREDGNNILFNSTFSTDLHGWKWTNAAAFISNGLSDDGYMYFTDLYGKGSFYTEKTSVAQILNDSGTLALRIMNNTVAQPNSWFRTSTSKYSSESSTGCPVYTMAFYVKVVRAGILSIGISGTSVWYSASLSVTDGYRFVTVSGKNWTGYGDFTIACTGEMYIHSLSLGTDSLATLHKTVTSEINQTAESICLSIIGTYTDPSTGKTVTKDGSYLSVLEKEITAKVSQTDYDSNNEAVSNRFSSITETVDGISASVGSIQKDYVTSSQLSQTASDIQADVSKTYIDPLTKRLTTAESNITANADSISTKISIKDGMNESTSIMSYIVQNSDSLSVLANRIMLYSVKQNLAMNTTNFRNTNYWSVGGSAVFYNQSSGKPYDDTAIYFKIPVTGWGSIVNFSLNGIKISTQKKYTLSVLVKPSLNISSFGLQVGNQNSSTFYSVTKSITAGTWNRLTYTFPASTADTETILDAYYIRFFIPQPATETTVAIKELKFEVGEFATTYCQNINDSNFSTDSDLIAQYNTTTISGGLQLTTKIKLGQLVNNAWTEQGGISANLNSENVMLWAGGTYDQAVAGTAPLILHHDGTGNFTGNVTCNGSDSKIKINADASDHFGLSYVGTSIQMFDSSNNYEKGVCLYPNGLQFGIYSTKSYTGRLKSFSIELYNGYDLFTIYNTWPTMAQASTNQLYKDDNGFLKVKTS